MKYAALLLAALLLMVPPAAAALDLHVHVDAPAQILPGEEANITVRATISGIPVISFPANVTVTFPDGSTVPLELENTFEGSYVATVYSVTEGRHVIDASVPIEDQIGTASAVVEVRKPSAGISVTAASNAGALNGVIDQQGNSSFAISIAPFAAGDLSKLTYEPACTIVCSGQCDFSCATPHTSGIARVTTQKGYTYDVYVPFGSSEPTVDVTYDTVSGVAEPLTAMTSVPATVYALFGSQLTQMPIVGDHYETTPHSPGNGSIVVRLGEQISQYPVEIITRTNVQQFTPSTAAGSATSWWYGFVHAAEETLLRLPTEPGTREAYLLRDSTRTPLRWEKAYVVVPAGSGWVEVRRAQPAGFTTQQNDTAYGTLLGGSGLQRHELSGTVLAYDSALATVPTYYNGSTSVLYTQDALAAAIGNVDGELAITQPLQSGMSGTIRYALPESNVTDTAFSIYTFAGALQQRLLFSGSSGTREIVFSMPVGQYIAVASGVTSAATPLLIYSDEPSITMDAPQTLRVPANSEITIQHTVTNNDLQLARTVELSVNSSFTVLINATDTNSNGLVDVTLAPGASQTVSAVVFIKQQETSGNLTLEASSGDLSATVTDTIVLQAPAAPTYIDADVVSITGEQGHASAVIQNNHETDLPATIYINGPQLSTQISTLLVPGLNNISLPDVGETATVRLQVNGDTRPENNERTRHFRQPFSTRLVHINERLHSDHAVYTVQLPTVPGHVLSWIDASGGEQQATATPMGENTLWHIGPLAANQEFYAALLPGEPVVANVSTLIDNSHPQVTRKGTWVASISTPGYIGFDYLLDLNIDKGAAVIYAPQLGHDRYEIYMHTPADNSFAPNTPVTVHGGASSTTLSVNQKRGGWQYLGLYEMHPNGSVAVENSRTTQFVVADALLFTPVSQIGGLLLTGNSTIDIHTRVGKQATVHVRSYLEGVLTMNAPDTVTVQQTGNTVHLTASTEGTYTITIGDGERTLTILLTASQPLVYTSNGDEVPVTVALKRNGKVQHEKLLPDQARAQKGRYEMDIDFVSGPVRRITIHDADPSQARIGVERVANEHARSQAGREVRDAFAINPGFNSSYSITKVAVGRQLLKCTEYDFASQVCSGGFIPVDTLIPGKEYTLTFTPEDPLFVEVDDEILPPIFAECALSGVYADPNCLGTYDTTPTCSNERVWCDDSSNRESFTGNRDAVMGIQATYSDVNRDPVEDCDEVKDVWVEYDVWESGDAGLTYWLSIDADDDGFVDVRSNVAVPNSQGTRIQWDVTSALTGGETWDCDDFFGPSATARARIQATRGGSGSPGNSYTLEVDYLAYRVDYNFTQQPIETDFNEYVQGQTVQISGEDLWDNSVLVTINITRAGTFVGQVNTTTNASGHFSAVYNLSDYAALGSYNATAWQPSNTSKIASNDFDVNIRTPTITTQVVGDYFNRTQTVIFTGTHWAKSTSIAINVTDPEGTAYTVSPTSNTTNTSGGLQYYWTIPSTLDLLTGQYTFLFVESANASYNNTKPVQVVILPNTASDDEGTNEINNINKFDGSNADFIDNRAPTSTEFLRMAFPPVAPTNGITLNSLRLQFFHVESASASNVYVQWLNSTSSTWSTICTIPARSIAGWDNCSLTTAITSISDRNNMDLRLSDAGTDAWPSTPTYNIDIAFLEVNFTFPPPNVSLVTPANNTLVGSSSQALRYNATDEFFGISECRVYVNGSLQHTNNSFAVNGTATYTHSFSEGNNSWYAACTDTSGRALVGTSATRYLLVDLTNPLSAINTPTSNYTWFNTNTPNVNFTSNDSMDATLNYTVYINSTVSTSSTMANNSHVVHTFAAQADGLKTAIIEVWDDVFRYATNKTVLFYVDTTAPTVNLISPVDEYNTSATSVAFSWNYTDLLSANATCLLYVNGIQEHANATTLNGTATSSGALAIPEGAHNWTVSCADVAGNSFQAVPRDFTVDNTPPTVNLMSPANLASFTTTRNATLSYNVSDALTSLNYCELYVDSTFNQSTASPTQDTELNFNVTDLDNGAYEWYVRCSDNVSNWGYSENRTFLINITALAQAPAANTRADRDGTDATDPDVVMLVANLTDGQAGATVTFHANLSAPSGIAGQTNILLGTNVTNASGQAILWFNPNSSMYAGNYSWWVEEARSLTNNSLPLLVYGGVSGVFADNTLHPLAAYNNSDTVTTLFNVTSAGPETAATLNASYAANLTVNFTQPNGSLVQHTALYNGGQWNGSYALSAAELGMWNATAQTAASWFYEAAVAQRQFVVYGHGNAISPANDTVVDRDGVDADPDVITLIVELPAAQQMFTVNFTANLTAPLFGGQTDILLGTNTTNSSGHAILHFNPNSSLYAGNYTWWAVSNVSYVNSTARFSVFGGLDQVFYSPVLYPDDNYTQNDSAVTVFNVTSVGGPETRDEINASYNGMANYTLSGPIGDISSSAAYTIFGIPVYWSVAALIPPGGVGYWNASGNVSADYFYGTSVADRNFTVYGYMNVTSHTLSADPIFAFQGITSTCAVLDQHTQSAVSGANVSYYLDGSFIGWNSTNSSGHVDYSLQVNTSGTHTLTCNVTDQLGIFYYAGEANTLNSTLTVLPFTVDAVGPANGTRIDRDGVDGTDADAVMLNASAPSWIPDGETISFYGNSTSPAIAGETDLLLGTNTTTGGFAVLWFNPNSSIYAGSYTWFANHTAGVTNSTRTFAAIGGLHVAYRSETGAPDSSYFINDTALVELNLSSYGPESRDNLSSPYSLAAQNTITNTTGDVDTTALSYTSPYWNATHTLLNLFGVGVWNTSANASGTHWYMNTTNRTFTVDSFMNITANTTTPASIYTYEITTQACTVQDQFTQYAVSGANVTFYRDGSLIGWNTTNAAGVAVFSFQVNDSGSWSITCNLTDQPNIYYFAGDESERNTTLTVLPFPITPVGPANGTAVDRDSGSGSVADVIALNVTVPSLIPDGVSIEFRANLTDPLGTAEQNVLLGTNTTNNSAVVLYYNPNSSSYAGAWTWFGNHSSAVQNGSMTFESYGSVNITFSYANDHPNATYYKPVNVSVASSIVPYGFEDENLMNSSYAPALNATLLYPNGTTAIVLDLLYNGSDWNSTHSLATSAARGNWTALLNATLDYMYIINASQRNFFVVNYPPEHSNPVLNASDNPLNTTIASLSTYNQSTTDAEGDRVENIYSWYKDNSPIAIIQAPFEGGSNSTYTKDYSGNDLNGSVSGAVWTENAMNGSSVYSFDGSNSWIDFGDVALVDGATELSVSVWVQIDDLTKDNDVLTKGSHAANQPLVIWRDEAGAEFGRNDMFAVLIDSVRYESAAGSANDNGWHHLVVTYEGGSPTGLRVYIDGVEDAHSPVSTVAEPTITPSANPLLFGRPSGSLVQTLDGMMDDLRIYGTALSAEQAYQLYYERVSGLSSSTIVANETSVNEIWQACVTPNDGFDDGEPLCTNNLTVFGLVAAVSANGSLVDRDSVSAPDADSINLTAYTYDDEGVNVSFYANLTSPALGVTDLLLGTALSNASGHAVLAWNPNASYYAGNYSWWPSAANSSTTSTGTFTVNGGLQIAHRNSSSYPSENHTQNETVATHFNLTSPGPETNDQLSASYGAALDSVLHNTSQSTDLASASYTSPYWNASHYLRNLDGVGMWNSSANASALFFYGDSTSRNVTVFGYMNITSNTSTPGSILAYQTTIAACSVQDQFTQYAVSGANVTFYRDGTYIGYNTTNSSGETQFAVQINDTGVHTITCNLTDQTAIYYYAGDEATRNITVTVLPFRMDTAGPVNGTIVDRDSADATDPDALLLNITTDSHVPDGTIVEFRANITDPLLGVTDLLLGSNTTVSANAVLWFNPNSSVYAGNWTWFGNHSAGSANSSATVIIRGSLATVFRSDTQHPNASYNETDTVTIEANLTSLGIENRSDLNSTYGAAINAQFTRPDAVDANRTLSFTNPFWNTTFNILDLTGVGNWTVRLQSNASYFYDDNSSNRSFFVYGLANVTDIALSSSSIYAFESVTAQCRVINAVHGNPIEDYQVEFFRNSTNVGNSTTNSSGHATYTFQTNQSGTYDVNCTIAENLSGYYYVDNGMVNTTLVVNKVPVTPVSPANDSVIDRDGVSADADSILLNASVPAGVPDGVTIEFRGNLTEPALGQNNILLGTNTTLGGFVVLHFDPNSTTYAGNWSWFGLQDEADPNGSARIHIIGSYAPVYADGSLNPNSTYFMNDTIISAVNLTSAGPESRTVLNASYSAAVNATLTNTSSSSMVAAMLFNGSLWRNSTLSPLDLFGVGVWNHSVQSSVLHFYDVSDINRSFTVYGYMNITANNTTPSTIIAYQQTTTACNVQDQHTGYAVSGANVTYYLNSTYLGSNTTDTSGTAGFSFQVNTTGTYTMTCNVTSQPSIYYVAGDAPKGNSTLTVVPFSITPVGPANGTPVDRDGMNASSPDAIALNVTVPGFVPDGVTITFSANLTDPGIGVTDVVLGSNTTLAGVATLYHNPNSSSHAGSWAWFPSNTNALSNGTRLFSSFGAANISFTSGTVNPDSNYTKPVNMTTSGTLQSYGFENSSYFETWYSPQLNATLRLPDDSVETSFGLFFNGSSWNNSHEIIISRPRGTWRALLDGSLDYTYIVNSENRTFEVLNIPPTHTAPVLNASDHPLNYTNANLTAYNQSTYDAEGDAVTNIYTWSVDGTQIMDAYYPFDSASASVAANAIRDYANDNNGTLGGGSAAQAPAWIPAGISGGAYRFDGVDDELVLDDIDYASGNFTISAWFNASTQQAGAAMILTKHFSPSNQIYLMLIAPGNALGGLYDGNDWQEYQTATSYKDSAWHMASLVVNSTHVALYMDGVLSGTDTHDNTFPVNNNPWRVGEREGDVQPFNGTVDDVRFYSRSLSAEQIAQLYAEGSAGIGTSTIVSSETHRNEVWQACVTPNDNIDDGVTLCSDTLTVFGLLEVLGPVNSTRVDRDSVDSTDADTIDLLVTTYGDPGVNVTFYANLTAPAVPGQTALVLGSAVSNASGYAVLSFDPNSSHYAGNYTWYPVATNSSTLNAGEFSVLGGLNLTRWNTTANPSSNHTQNESVDARYNLTSPGAETHDNISSIYNAGVTSVFQNAAGANDTLNASYSSPYWNATHRLLDLSGLGVWNVSANASADHHYNSTFTTNFSVYGYANVTEIDITPNPIDAYNTALMSCRVQDQDTAAPVNAMNVSFYQQGTFIGSNTTNSSGHAIIYRLQPVLGNFSVLCNITDDLSLYYYAGSVSELNTTIEVTPILLTPQDPANGTILDRDAVGAAAEATTLVARVLSTVPDSIVMDFWANLTDPVIGGQTDIYLGSNITNGSYINLTFNPNSSLYAGSYVWWVNSSGGTPNGTQSFALYGGVNISYVDNESDPLLVYNKSLQVNLTLNVSSLGIETAAQLNSTYGALVNVTLTKPGGTTDVAFAPYNGSAWNASYPLTGEPYGVWNTTAVLNASYFFAVPVDLRNFTVYEMTNISVFDDEEFIGYTIFANTPQGYYANYTNSSFEPVLGATCIASFFDRNSTLNYNASTGLYEAYELFSLEGIVRYNVSCTMPFHYDGFDTNNASVHSLVNITVQGSVLDNGPQAWLTTLNVSNLQNYTEHDVWLHQFTPPVNGITFSTSPVDTQLVSGGEFGGNVTRWYLPNLTGGSSTLIQFTVNTTENISMLSNTALKVYSMNTSVIYE